MDVAFYNAVAFDQYIGAWDVSKVTETVGDPSNFRSVENPLDSTNSITFIFILRSRGQN